MSNLKSIKEALSQYLKNKERFINFLKQFVVNKNYSLEDRWEVFIESDLGDISGCVESPPGIDWNRITLYDDFYKDRYATVLAVDMLYRINDDESGKFKDFDEVAFKEFFLQEFKKGFIHDW